RCNRRGADGRRGHGALGAEARRKRGRGVTPRRASVGGADLQGLAPGGWTLLLRDAHRVRMLGLTEAAAEVQQAVAVTAVEGRDPTHDHQMIAERDALVHLAVEARQGALQARLTAVAAFELVRG